MIFYDVTDQVGWHVCVCECCIGLDNDNYYAFMTLAAMIKTK